MPFLGPHLFEGLAFCDNGEIARTRIEAVYGQITATATHEIGYDFWVFEDGSTILERFQRLVELDKNGNPSAKGSTQSIKGDGPFYGNQGNTSPVARTSCLVK